MNQTKHPEKVLPYGYYSPFGYRGRISDNGKMVLFATYEDYMEYIDGEV